MIPRSLRLSTVGIQKASIEFVRTGLTQDELAKRLEISRSTLTNFLSGNPIYRSNFFKICQALKLNPIEVCKPTNELLSFMQENDQQAINSQQHINGRRAVNLSQWFQKVFEADWQAVEAIFGIDMALSFRSINSLRETRRAKLIDFGMLSGGYRVVLLIALIKDIQEINIRAELHPTIRQTFLPPNFRLILLSELKATLEEVQSSGQDYYIQLSPIKGLPGESFSIQVTLDDVSIREDFVI
ncbi:DUF1822 family protein [Trichocoleus sp. FACHB-90]|uniref:DUF1822 family protein n=1 Tax=Cyanophyceae TaxID=3028117 RepID=UPI001687A0D6|nr:DUF1822 family protein [Trichocoleus sp. FACHB-90]MBD1929959.1 DUF1822 family protein [Trichocoleus sp. FACHB-90]